MKEHVLDRSPSESSQTESGLRFGVMASGKQLRAWQKECIQQLLALDGVELSLLIEDARSSTWKDKISSVRPSQFLFQACKRIAFNHDAGKVMPSEDLFADADVMEVESIRKEGYSEYFPEDKIEKIENYDLDFVIRFAFGIIRGEILEVADYGIWSFHHDDERKYRGGPPCFWEVYYGDERTGFILQRLTDRLDGGIILRRGSVQTAYYSYVENMDRAYKESASLPADVCREILSSDDPSLKEKSDSEAPIYSYPKNYQFILFLVKILWRRVKSTFQG